MCVICQANFQDPIFVGFHRLAPSMKIKLVEFFLKYVYIAIDFLICESCFCKKCDKSCLNKVCASKPVLHTVVQNICLCQNCVKLEIQYINTAGDIYN